jgi:hypothetical protein
MTSSAAAPSQIWLEVAAVRRPSGASGLRAPIEASEVSRRGQVSADTSASGAISGPNQPSSIARTARWWLRSASSSIASRLMPHLAAIISADRNCDTSTGP